MTTILNNDNELEQRLRQLESEQDSQNIALNTFGDFEKEIRKLEAALAEINNYTIEQVEDDFERDELEETKKLERELQRMSQEDLPPQVRSQPQTQMVNKKNENTGSLKPPTDNKTAKQQKTVPSPSPNSATQSYVICLMFNPKSPQEWSGNGWCEYGKGMRYTNPEQAKQTFKKLKKQWPSYPLKIFNR